MALILVLLCLVAANWQFQRGLDRKDKNSLIEANLQKEIVPLDSLDATLKSNEWRMVKIKGRFDKSHEVLLRNRYSPDGKYGFEYLTLFATGERRFWIDRGWVKAGDTALERPKTPLTPTELVEIVGRIRLDSSLPRGSFFALPASGNLINQWNLRSKVETEAFYIDLISGPNVAPEYPAQLPELSDGPHLAYAVQWLFFAGLVIYGRFKFRGIK